MSKRIIPLAVPHKDALRLGAEAASGRGNSPVRTSFVRASADEVTPLAHIMGAGGQQNLAGQGGGTRLKLLLSLLWLSGGGDHITHYRTKAYATLFQVDGGTADTRRINRALLWLANRPEHARAVKEGSPNLSQARQRRYIELLADDDPELPESGGKRTTPRVRLLREDGQGEPYSRPKPGQVDPDDEVGRHDEVYFDVPHEFWTQGWAAVLSGAAIATLLMLLEDNNLRRTPGARYIPPDRRKQYGFSNATWARGSTELWAYGIVDVTTNRQVTFAAPTSLTLYTLKRDALKGPVRVRDEVAASFAKKEPYTTRGFTIPRHPGLTAATET